MTFDEWYDSYYAHEWYAERRHELRLAWERLRIAGISDAVIADVFYVVANAIAAQYGE